MRCGLAFVRIGADFDLAVRHGLLDGFAKAGGRVFVVSVQLPGLFEFGEALGLEAQACGLLFVQAFSVDDDRSRRLRFLSHVWPLFAELIGRLETGEP